MDAIMAAEKQIADAKANLANAVKTTFPLATRVLIKGPRGDKETQVVGVEGEDLLLETANGSMKRHYSTVRLT